MYAGLEGLSLTAEVKGGNWRKFSNMEKTSAESVLLNIHQLLIYNVH